MIGCGAIAEGFHLPALTRSAEIRDRLILVDRDAARSAAMARKFGVQRTANDYREVLGEVQGAVLAVPPRLHFTIAEACIQHKVHVLCEKPLTETSTDVDLLVAQAAHARVNVAVNNTRRLFPSARRLKAMLAAGEFGRVDRIEFLHGEKFDWPCASDAYFGPKAGGRGVLADTGAHVLDLVCWWLGGKPVLTGFEDDSFGGTEAVADVSARLGTTEVHVRLSWLSRLENVYRIATERGTIEGESYSLRSYTVTDLRGRRQTVHAARGAQAYSDLANALIDNFVEVVRGRALPLVSAADVAPSIHLIDECYARRRRFAMPWVDTFARYANA
jgi:predicted dehydrogenase